MSSSESNTSEQPEVVVESSLSGEVLSASNSHDNATSPTGEVSPSSVVSSKSLSSEASNVEGREGDSPSSASPSSSPSSPTSSPSSPSASSQSSVADVEDKSRDESSAEGVENGLFASVFSDMDKVERTLRVFLIVGIVPFTFVGWLVGLLYSTFVKKTKAIHRKLHSVLAILSAVSVFLGIVGFFIYYAYTKDVVTTPRSERIVPKVFVPLRTMDCNDMKFDYIKRDKGANNNVVFLFSGLAYGWHNHGIFEFPDNMDYNVIAVNINDKDEDLGSKYANVLEKVTKCFKLSSLPNKTLVVEFSDSNVESLVKSKNWSSWKNVMAINNEVQCKNKVETKNTDEPFKSPVSSLKTHIGYSNKHISCGREYVHLPVQVTEDGVNRYHRRGSDFSDVLNSFFTVTPLVKERCFRVKNSSSNVKSYLDDLVEPLDTFLNYTNESVLKSPLSTAILCNKAFSL